MHTHAFKSLLMTCAVVALFFTSHTAGAAVNQLRFETDLGAFAVDLYNDTPIAVANLLSYVDSGFYDDTVIDMKGVLNANESPPIFPDADIIHGGTADSSLTVKPTGTPIINTTERFHSNTPGTFAMDEFFGFYAAQWQINVNDNSHLDGTLTVIGDVSKGMSVVDTIWGLDAYDVLPGVGDPFYNMPLEDLDGDTGTHLPSEYVVIHSVLRNGDTDEDDNLDADDIDTLYDNAGATDILYDIALDHGTSDAGDVDALVRDIFFTEYGDGNLDGKVNPTDLADLTLNWLGSNKGWADGDYNGDGLVNPTDLAELTLNWLFDNGLGAQTAPATIPEPASVALLALGGIALLRRRR